MMNHNDIITMIQAGNDTSKMIDILVQCDGCTRNAAAKRIRRARDKMNNPIDRNPVSETQPNLSYDNMGHGDVVFTGAEQQGNGTIILDAVIASLKVGMVRAETVLEKYGLNPNEWKVISFKTSAWNAQQKGGNKTTLYSSKLTVCPKQTADLTREDIEEVMEEILNKKRDYPSIPYQISYSNKENGYVALITLADPHFGGQAWGKETGKPYNTEIAIDYVRNALTSLLQQIHEANIPVKKFLFATLGDVIHVDNEEGKTTKGTIQQTDGRLPRTIFKTIDFLIECVMRMEEIAPVDYLYVSGNHDRNTGAAVAKAVSCAFMNHPNVKFDIGPNPHKAYRIGQNLLIFSHGDIKGKDKFKTIMDRKLAEFDGYGIKQIMFYCGHLHSWAVENVSDGRYVEHIDATCTALAWENQQAFAQTPIGYMNCFLWSDRPLPPNRLIGAVE